MDDGSTDDSLEILNSYAAKDSRIHIYSLPENKGAAAARNHGMDQATGEYLGFVDCDDYPCLDFYEKLWRGTEDGKFDVVKGNYRYWGENGKSLPVDYSMNEELKKHKTSFSFAFSSAIYKRKFIISNKIFFPEDMTDIEDPIFALNVAIICNAINIVESAEINIRRHKYSMTYGIPTCSDVQKKFNGLRKIISIINIENNISAKSYAYIAAFWFNSVLFESMKNKSERAFRNILDNLWFAFLELKNHLECEAEFNRFGINEVYSSLQSGCINNVVNYLIRFYDKKIFLCSLLKERINKHNMKFKSCIAIPIYKEFLSEIELKSLSQCIKILNKYPIRFLCPESLDITKYIKLLERTNVDYGFERFPNVFFKSTYHYNRLMLNPDLYKRFIDYEFMLVYQLDAWVFRDELSYWCDQGFDYIGAPWYEGYEKATHTSKIISPSGNGGFSLRKNNSIMNALYKTFYNMVNKKSCELNFYENEDVTIVNFKKNGIEFNIAPASIGIYFASEFNFNESLRRTNGVLPFGNHKTYLLKGAK